jgi:hypothetical protein
MMMMMTPAASAVELALVATQGAVRTVRTCAMTPAAGNRTIPSPEMIALLVLRVAPELHRRESCVGVELPSFPRLPLAPRPSAVRRRSPIVQSNDLARPGEAAERQACERERPQIRRSPGAGRESRAAGHCLQPASAGA